MHPVAYYDAALSVKDNENDSITSSPAVVEKSLTTEEMQQTPPERTKPARTVMTTEAVIKVRSKNFDPTPVHNHIYHRTLKRA